MVEAQAGEINRKRTRQRTSEIYRLSAASGTKRIYIYFFFDQRVERERSPGLARPSPDGDSDRSFNFLFPERLQLQVWNAHGFDPGVWEPSVGSF